MLRDPVYGLYPYGTLVQLTAQPDSGFEFIRWSDGITNQNGKVAVFPTLFSQLDWGAQAPRLMSSAPSRKDRKSVV